jgi:protein-S-isoprenylcysteine O-methyltransferase Ste14
MYNIENYKKAIKLYFSSIFIYGLGLWVILYLPYYQNMLSVNTEKTICYIFLSYVILAPIIYFFKITKYSENKPHLFLQYLTNIFRKKKIRPTKEQKVAMLFLIVKIYFLPMLINFFWGNFNHLKNMFSSNLAWYPIMFTLMFTVDTVIFSFGYAFEFKSMKNVVKSVEPTLFGWTVALICYPPFNSIVGKYVPWGANDYVHFWSANWTIVMRVIVLLLLFIYMWATVALGPKSSNLTNRGIVSRFPYNIIRHPAYVSKNLIWWLTLLPIINWKFALGMSFWTVIYYFRAMTEERHLSQDQDYLKYKKKVKWKFIPKLI